MRRLILVACIVFSATAAHAAPADWWHGPGWYQWLDAGVMIAPVAGPFASEAECKAVLPPNTDDEQYSCEYLAKPD